jgi:hypothetical protein
MEKNQENRVILSGVKDPRKHPVGWLSWVLRFALTEKSSVYFLRGWSLINWMISAVSPKHKAETVSVR